MKSATHGCLFRARRCRGALSVSQQEILGMLAIALVGGAYVVASGVRPLGGGQQSFQPIAPSKLAEPAPQARPFYVYDDRAGRYGYKVPLSDADKSQGIATKPLAMFEYAGRFQGDYRFAEVEGRRRVVFICPEPCDMVREYVTGGEPTASIPVERDTVLWEVVQDMKAGQMRQSPRQF